MSVSGFSRISILVLLLIATFWSCKEDDNFNEGPFQSKRTAILSFDFNDIRPGQSFEGSINAAESRVNVVVPFGTDLRALVPTIAISEKATISPPSGIANNFTQPATYIVTAEDGTTQAWTVVVEESDEEPRLSLSPPVWNRSPAGSGVPSFFTPDGERGIDFGNGHLYVTSNNDKILILSPADGSQIGSLDMSGVSGGEPKIADIEVSADGSILACNTVEWTSDGGGAPTTFKIYRWEDETSQPTLWLSYTNTQYRMGDTFTVIGDVSGDAVVLTSFGRKFLNPTDRGNLVFKWTVTGGVLNPEPEIIPIQGVPTLTRLGSRPHAQLLRPDSEELYVNANDIDFTRTALDGTFQARIPNGGRQLYDGFTSHFEIFEFAGKRVLVTAFPRSNIESRLIVIDITNGLENVTAEDVILSQNFMQGAGEIANVNASGAVAINPLENNRVEVYVLITNQVLAKFILTTSL
ncbi:DUF5018 domain-containing protein [Cesiribacter andamanensis]|uniref:Putative glycoside hydrolase n=1 Tax=Cesiribacter andamanensis AMV16 TaxID=1279009 RepID=M7NL82_9BACT|nr:DUF5018 domain-containing protein [Cesiribacter andamanensis]EMR02555.1 Putative glycoside hydrolase [Cesiribacter andamanensis AMV16]